MKCLVCENNFSEKLSECPLCGFPVVEVLGEDFDAGMASLRPTIEKKKKQLAQSVSIAAVTYQYDVENGKVKEIGKEKIPMGSFAEIMGTEKWFEQKYEGTSVRQELSLELEILLSGKPHKTITVSVPNLPEADQLVLGLSGSESFTLTVKLKDENNHVTQSESIPVLE